jgi:hypothetical protein
VYRIPCECGKVYVGRLGDLLRPDAKNTWDTYVSNSLISRR